MLAGLGALLYTRIAGWLVRRFGERGLLIGGGAGLVVWLGGVALFGLPLPAWLGLLPLAVLGLWAADQVAAPWRQRPRPPDPVRGLGIPVLVTDLLRRPQGPKGS